MNKFIYEIYFNNSPKIELKTKFQDSQNCLSAEIQFCFQIWSSNFSGLDLSSYPTLGTSVKYTLYTSKFIRALLVVPSITTRITLRSTLAFYCDSEIMQIYK